MQETCRKGRSVIEQLEKRILSKANRERKTIETWFEQDSQFGEVHPNDAIRAETMLAVFENLIERIEGMKTQCGAALQSALAGELAYLNGEQERTSYPHASGGPNYPPTSRMKVVREALNEAFHQCWVEVGDACDAMKEPAKVPFADVQFAPVISMVW